MPVSVHISRFRGQSGVEEYHLVIRPRAYAAVEQQLAWLMQAYRSALDEAGLDPGSAVLRRYFCSDLRNQSSALKACPAANPLEPDVACAVSWVGQPPDAPAKVSLWAYHIRDPRAPLVKAQTGTQLTLCRESLSHLWTTGMTAPGGATSYDQTRGIFEAYTRALAQQGMSLSEHAMRTWLFVQDIDAQYQGLVTARREFFTEHGLTPQTHFIASSGIGGSHVQAGVCVAMDAYAIGGLKPGQVSYLTAPDHLSATHVYGVTFERGTSVAYRDRKHLIISGTASIDADGRILHAGDVSRQLDRTLENVEALLGPAGASLSDMCVCIVYVRDSSDQERVRERTRERVGDAPVEVLTAGVCRPGWLVEVEGVAVIPASNPKLPPF